MEKVKVPGVLNRNSKTRDEHLKRNYGKYFQYTENLTPAIGEVYNIDYNRPLYSITDNQPLLEYSHNNTQPYGQSINRKYFNKNREKDIYSVKELSFDQIQAWGGDYTDYITYLDDVLGEDVYSRHVRYINDLLSGQYMENALRQTEVGVIRDINVPVAKQGIITTNPNNLKGLDTPLGTITNYMYSTLLYNGAIFNSDRRSEDKYITRSLINQYGNNLSNVTKLGDMLRVGVGDYNLREDLGGDAHIVHNFNEPVGDLNIHWMAKNVETAKKYLSEFNKEFSGYELGKEGYVDVIDKIKNSRNSNIFTSIYKHNTDRTYPIYNENDFKGLGYLNIDDGEDEDRINDSVDIDISLPNVNHEDASWEDYNSIAGTSDDKKSILSKTAKLFNEHKINTLVGRFHTSVDGGISTEQEFIDTAKSVFGNSHGRNLLTRKAQDSEVNDNNTNGYDNPYCRTWTYHHQYNQVKKLIRPFITLNDNGEETAMSIESVQNFNARYRSKDKDSKDRDLIGPKYLGKNTVLNSNGFVNICPSGSDDVNSNGTRIEKCMFSIENLAWKDVPKFTKENYISKEQTGPNGGRIMWFPPYDLSFSENVNVAWNESTFIGRGEKVYTYTNTDRTGTLSFTLLIDHPSLVNTFSRLEDGDISSDIDSDILRYFAGCEIPNIKVKEPENDEKSEEYIDKGVEELKRHEKFSFYVYFPNNFSGIISNANGKDFDSYYSDWWKYILLGNNCDLRTSKNEWVGYETTKDNGISVQPIDDKIKEDWIGVSQCWWDKNPNCVGIKTKLKEDDAKDEYGNSLVDKKTGKNCYRYRVDSDLRQALKADVSFIDNNSNQLNTKLSKSDANYSFGEVIASLIVAKRLSAGSEGEDSINIDSEKVLEFLFQNGCSSDSVKELSGKLKAKGLTIDKIKISGSADNNDKSNSKMLANRRCESVKRLFKDLKEIGIKDENINCTTQSSTSNASKSANDKSNKLERCVFVTVEYTLPGTKESLSSMSEEATNEPEEDDEEMFNTWFDSLLSNSEILSEYRLIFDNDDYEDQYQLFKQDVKKQCISNEISYNIDDYTTDQKWVDAINKLVGEYLYEYFIPAEKTSNFSDDFISQLNNHKPVNFNDNIDKEIDDIGSEIVSLNNKIDDYTEKISKLREELHKVEEKKSEKDLSTKIEECEKKILCYTNSCEGTPSGTTQYQNEIDRINYELGHWTTDKGDKTNLLNELKRCEREKSNLTNKIGKEQAKKDKYQQELDEFDDEIKSLRDQIQTYEDKINEDQNKESNLADQALSLAQDKSLGKGIIADKVKSEIYFERLLESDENFLNNLKGDGPNGESDKFNYDNYSGNLTNLFETGILMQMTAGFPYDGYNSNHDKSFANNSENPQKMSYNLLLKEYLLIKLLDKNIDGETNKGFEFACEYLMSKNQDNYEQIKDLLYIQYILSGEKNKTKNGWNVSTNGTSANISYYDAWEYIIYNESGLSINYEPFKKATKDVSTAIKTYKDIQSPTDDDFNDLIKVITGNTASVLKYCETVIDDIMFEVIAYANSAYDSAKTAAEDADKDKESQKLKKKYQSECDTLKSLKDSVSKKKDQYLYSISSKSKQVRYETESEYFEKLNIEHPLIFKSIKDKFKYFNPAFHSMSPEGFNARLNFLHQCTRQGHTYEAKAENGITTAHNLAFGRMPVCVLRIGDFINTRIIINNVNISYDNGGMQWDLNPEGIGVQPMYAKVNLGITIIGGQSLNGPISRLQNAVSFDYYANTGVYDNRADRVHRNTTIGGNGEMIYDYVFGITPSENQSDYTLYRNPEVNNSNDNYIDQSKKYKEEYDNAKKELNDYNLTKGNNTCEK